MSPCGDRQPGSQSILLGRCGSASPLANLGYAAESGGPGAIASPGRRDRSGCQTRVLVLTFRSRPPGGQSALKPIILPVNSRSWTCYTRLASLWNRRRDNPGLPYSSRLARSLTRAPGRRQYVETFGSYRASEPDRGERFRAAGGYDGHHSEATGGHHGRRTAADGASGRGAAPTTPPPPAATVQTTPPPTTTAQSSDSGRNRRVKIGAGVHYMETVGDIKDAEGFDSGALNLLLGARLGLGLITIEGDSEWALDYGGSDHTLWLPSGLRAGGSPIALRGSGHRPWVHQPGVVRSPDVYSAGGHQPAPGAGLGGRQRELSVHEHHPCRRPRYR